jgi:deazaflavin-dependent oxidoreductase (nitroreductase family)
MISTDDSSPLDIKSFNARLIDEFRANRGTVSGQPEGALPLLLLTTTGAISGQPRTSPLACLAEGDRYYIAGPYLGAARHPAWYHNLVADPNVMVEVGAEVFGATARVLDGEERERIWTALVARNLNLPTWQKQIARVIPIVELTPKSGHSTQ